MQTFKIHTWSCECGYHQDFEPTAENNAKHFKGLPAGACPSCGLTDGLKKEADPAKKIEMSVLDSQADLDALRDRELAKPKHEIREITGTGKKDFIKRVETDEERDGRITEMLSARRIASAAEIKALRDRHEDKG